MPKKHKNISKTSQIAGKLPLSKEKQTYPYNYVKTNRIERNHNLPPNIPPIIEVSLSVVDFSYAVYTYIT